MLEKYQQKRLLRYGINENSISHFNNTISDYLKTARPKKVTENTIIFSDIHANYPALQLMHRFAQDNNIDSFISLGDIIEYNNQNDEVLYFMRSLNQKFLSNIRGNHDNGTLNNEKFISNLFQDIIDESLGNYLLNLPQNDVITINGKKILLCHSNPWNADILYLFPEETNFFEYFLKKLDCDGFLFGHTHFVTFYKSKALNNKFAFNPGSLGVSRDGENKLYFSVLEPLDQKFTIYGFTSELPENPGWKDTKISKIQDFRF